MYLLDTNIWLERLLEQEHSDDVGRLLDQISSDQLFITDFSFHSICLVLTKLKRPGSAIDHAFNHPRYSYSSRPISGQR